MVRKIIHIDMDAFYASIEQRDNPDYRGKPVAVGYPEARGVVAAASYEARRYGVRSAMASTTALKRCPHLIFVPPHFDVYHAVSDQIRQIFLDYTDLVEPLSLDEAFLDVTENKKGNPSATIIAREIKQRIKEETGLTTSAGVSFNKFLAKIASDYRKPDGLFVVRPQAAEKFVETLRVEQFFGVGKVTAEKMHKHGIRTGADLKKCSEAVLVDLFGKAGHQYYLNARGLDYREVEPDRITKSVSAESTFDQDKDSVLHLQLELYQVALEVIKRMEKEQFFGRTVTVKIKFADFKIITRSRTLPEVVKDFQQLWSAAKTILRNTDLGGQKVRLLGLGISNAGETAGRKSIQLQLDLF
ncbi:DNA polymerase IV [Paludibacter sp.]|uniref:DNA polymerase IV n=1 Tax=Paludibacter sp. TaxID=1898105 RepID=UPI001356081E|nr:DNA polymerase IV [Paludibacter sp.]MTK52414.1 DNA polymerase IV [Paludibacter sp.]